MKAIRIHEYGGSEKLVYEEAPNPEIKDDDVLVKIYAVSVNHLEIKKASGIAKDKMPLDLPWIPGYDFSGLVVYTGSKVKSFQSGDAVYGNCNGGSYAEYLKINLSTVVKKPHNLSFIEAASVPHVAETAWQAIHKHGQLQEGQKVLIHGASGAVGAYAVQFAKITGGEVYASASLDSKEYLESLGIDVFIDYRTADFAALAEDMDLVIDLVGGETQEKSYQVLKKGGKLVSTVGINSPDKAKENNITAIGMVIEQSGEDLIKITKLIDSGDVQTDVALTYPLQKATEAWDILNKKEPSLPKVKHGKIVLFLE